MISLISQLLHRLYAIPHPVDVCRFIISKEELNEITRAYPAIDQSDRRECLIVLPSQNHLDLALYIDPEIIMRLQHLQLSDGLTAAQLDELCVAIEGVSHLLLTIVKNSQNSTLTQLEMETQAEVDKFIVTYALIGLYCHKRAPELLHHLFHSFALQSTINGESAERYLFAHLLARRFCIHLWKHFLERSRLSTALFELRRFYAASHWQKLDYLSHTIAR